MKEIHILVLEIDRQQDSSIPKKYVALGVNFPIGTQCHFDEIIPGIEACLKAYFKYCKEKNKDPWKQYKEDESFYESDYSKGEFKKFEESVKFESYVKSDDERLKDVKIVYGFHKF